MRVLTIAMAVVASVRSCLASKAQTLEELQARFPTEDKELLANVAHIAFEDVLAKVNLRESVLR